MQIEHDEVAKIVEWIASFGGTPEGGTTRLLYSAEWLQAQQALKTEMAAVGMSTQFDDVGNLFGRVEGTQYPDEVIMSGSHVDTVVNGGQLDGQLGIVAAFLAIKYLVHTYGKPLRTLEVVSLAEEEGSRFPYVFWGSKNLFGLAKPEDVASIKDAKGVGFVAAMNECGFQFSQGATNKNIQAFVELHIEQGGVLEAEQKQIGVVTSIAGQRRYTVTLKGQSNHAGTTPMGYRKDAVYTFSRICHESINKAIGYGDPLVLTFGRVEPKPNVVNVVPGFVTFTIDCRHTDQASLIQFTQELESDMMRIAAEQDVEIDIHLWMDEPPIPMNAQLTAQIENICQKNRLSYRVMHSGAGHDAQIFAPRVPTAMIFVPSIQGVSHNPAEKTAVTDLVEGVKTLAYTLYELAYQP